MQTSRFTPQIKTPEVWAFSWNKPRQAVSGMERPLTRDEYDQGQAVLIKVKNLSTDLREIFTGRFKYLLKEQGVHAAHKYLIYTLGRSILPRVDAVNSAHEMNLNASMMFMSEADTYHRLPSMSDKPLRRFAQDIAGQLKEIYEDRCDQLLAQYNGDNSILFKTDTQCELYSEIAGMAQAFNVTPMYWTRFCKGKLDAVSAIASMSRLVNPDWWLSQLKGQRTRWRESLLIAIGKVNRDASPYASKQAIREVRARRLSNLDYLKSCDLENIETGERFSLIDKVMASISNPEIRRMELMSTIAGTEKYAAANGDVGMFLTITTPSKYHPTRMVGKGDKKRVQRNHAWDKEAFTPKDAQRYLCGIWSKMRTAFKDNDLSVYGMRVVEPHHDATPHWHMMLFTKPAMRQRVIDIMRKYAMKEDGDERGAAKNRFDCKHMNRGGAAGYIAKYIAKNIDGYALEGERDHETGELLTDSAAAVTAWAATWRIPQFHPIGLPAMGSYRECRRIRSISLTETFDEEVEAVRAAADAGDFMAYMSAQGGANVPRDDQTVRVARRVADELNAYDEEVKKVVGIFAPHLGDSHVYETRTTQWRIVSSAVDVEFLTSKSASGAPRSPVNNCGLGGKKQATNWHDRQAGSTATASTSDNLRVIDWTDTAAVRAIVARIREETPRVSKAQRSFDPTKGRDVAPSARMTTEERARLPKIERELMKNNITAERWELEALSRGAKVSFGDLVMSFEPLPDWAEFE
ncbi:replication endonuclease [Rahnella woolbedingensis]|uniref:Replication endonuclease n=1 Tax=Rahnella woolbedingensis TaxID=1510574 RepID=A0A419N3E8_9GAMM|nr:replication endonuclease [Rahnella woolbedingensis]RJT37440.1 replication endonuclease [Rahnella woolbedingensis]